MKKLFSFLFSLGLFSCASLLAQPKTNAFLDSLIQVVAMAKQDTFEAEALFLICRHYHRREPTKGIPYGEKSLRLSKELGWGKGIAWSLRYLGDIYLRIGEPQKSAELFQEAIPFSQARKDVRLEGKLVELLGLAYVFQGKSEEALRYHQEALRVFQSYPDSQASTNVMIGMGEIYFSMQNYVLAQTWFEKALDWSQRLQYDWGEGTTLTTIGMVHYSQKNHEKALRYYRQAEAHFLERNDSLSLPPILGSIGSIYLDQQQYPEALAVLERARDILRVWPNQAQSAGLQTNLGLVYWEMGQGKVAETYFQEGLRLAKEMEDQRGISRNQGYLAEVYLSQRKYQAAEQLATTALATSREIKQREIEKNALEVLFQILEATDRPRQALDYHKQLMAVQDSLFNAETVRKITETEMSYAYQRQQLADSLANVQQQTATELVYQQQLSRRNYLLVGAVVLSLLGFLFFRYRQQVRSRQKELELQQERTRKAQLQELDALKSRFFTNISHEFRTPLTVMMGMAGQLPPEQQQTSSLIRRNGQRLLRLINQLLDLSRLESQELRLNPVQGDLVGYLRYLSESFQSLAEERGIDLRVTADPTALVMDYDPEKVQDIAYNLLSNALKFTPEEGEVVMEIAVEKSEGVERLWCRVRDTGPGILAEELPRIFDRFYQGAATAREGSTGVGLSLAKALVERMGGGISVQSEVGKGAVFSFWLPVQRAEDTPAAFASAEFTAISPKEEVVPAPQLVLPENPDRPQVLLIEDNADVITYLGAILGADYQLLTATDGQAGIEMAQQHVPDLIISDVMMPHKDGFEVTETLKTDARTSHIPIILLTAKATQLDKLAGLKHGADAYLTKPFDREELLVRVENLLEVRQKLQAYYREVLPTVEAEAELSKPPSLEEIFLQTIRELVQNKLADPELNVHHLCEVVHLSHTQTYRKLKALTGQTPTLFIRSARLKQARKLLETTQLNVSEIAYDVGFNDPNYFSRVFLKEFGIAPSETRQN